MRRPFSARSSAQVIAGAKCEQYSKNESVSYRLADVTLDPPGEVKYGEYRRDVSEAMKPLPPHVTEAFDRAICRCRGQGYQQHEGGKPDENELSP